MLNKLNELRNKMPLVLLKNRYGIKILKAPNLPDCVSRDVLSFDIDGLSKNVKFKVKAGELFTPFKFSKHDAQIIITSAVGSLDVITNDGVEKLEFPNTFILQKGKEIAIRWLNDADVLVLWK